MPLIQRFAVLLIASLPSIAQAETGASILAATGVRGGLVLHLGCGDGTLTAALGKGQGYLVRGLDRDAGHVATARRYVKSLGLYGKVSIGQFQGHHLPFVDNLVNLVVSEHSGDVPVREIMRVLRPGGVAYIKGADGWKKTVKRWPNDIDEWTHFLHGPDNNAVAHDRKVNLPRRLKWLGAPKFARAHEQAASFSACVTTAGRMFYVVDEAPRSDIRLPSQWVLVARDAFNGVVLWKRPIAKWVNQTRAFRSGPAETAFRLVAKDERIYVTLGLRAPVSVLDAATGRTRATVKGTENARQILYLHGKLIVLVDTAPELTAKIESRIRQGLKPDPGVRVIVAADPVSGKILWRKTIRAFVHPDMAAAGKHLFYQTNKNLVCVDLDSGSEVWRADRPLKLKGHELGWESPTLVVQDQVVYSADFKTIIAYSAVSGYVLWKAPCQAGYNSPPDVLVVNHLVWLKGRTAMIGLDPATGKVRKTVRTIGGYMHHRCYRDKATDRFFMLGIQGVQFVDVKSNNAWRNHWIRGTCQYGILPANGLLYVTPNSCACNMKSKLAGLWAIDSDVGRKTAPETSPADRLVTGPAYRKARGKRQTTDLAATNSWPSYRHDASRSGLTKAVVGAHLVPAWQTKLGGKLSGVTVAEGKLFVASIDTHTVYALDEQTGRTMWSFTADSRIDSPPTIYHGLALFGSADGHVYALRAADGELAWRFQAAPRDRFAFVNGALESVWPVHGSVLVHHDTLVVAAGRSSYLDGGIRLYRLDPQTGRMLSATVMYSPDPKTGRQPVDPDTKDVRGALTDILLADGDDIYMRHMKLDLKTGDETRTGLHLFSPTGFLDDSWWHRSYWLFNTEFLAWWGGWWKAGNVVPSGRILSYDATSIYGYGRDKYPSGNTGQFRGGEVYQLFACDRPTVGIGAAQLNIRRRKKRGNRRKTPSRKGRRPKPPARVVYRWVNHPPFFVRALLVTADKMFVAGPPDVSQSQGPGDSALVLRNPDQAVAAWQGKKGGALWVVGTRDGKRLAQYKLDAPPVFDGMAATTGRLFLATTDGRVICYAN